MMMSANPERRLWWARLAASSPRYADWYAILESDEVPLTSAGVVAATLLGEGREEVYLLDLEQLNEQQSERLVAALAKKFRASADEVRDGILQDGMPIRAADVYLAFDARAIV